MKYTYAHVQIQSGEVLSVWLSFLLFPIKTRQNRFFSICSASWIESEQSPLLVDHPIQTKYMGTDTLLLSLDTDRRVSLPSTILYSISNATQFFFFVYFFHIHNSHSFVYNFNSIYICNYNNSIQQQRQQKCTMIRNRHWKCRFKVLLVAHSECMYDSWECPLTYAQWDFQVKKTRRIQKWILKCEL